MRTIILVDPVHGPLTPLETPGPIYFTCVPDEKTWELLPGTKLHFDKNPWEPNFTSWLVEHNSYAEQSGDVEEEFTSYLDARNRAQGLSEAFANLPFGSFTLELFGVGDNGEMYRLDWD